MNNPTEALPLGSLMVDLAGETLTAEERDFLRHPAVGAIILFARNYRSKPQVSALIADIKALRTPALLVAVDQEGGRVQRFAEGFHKLPAPARIGHLYARDQRRAIAAAETAGWLMAAETRQTGVDFSFAPLLDCRHPHSRVIGDRAFHRDPLAVCALAGAYIDGMKRAGMAATGKHFPGHGGVRADSHERLPVDSRSMAEIEKRDLLPFARLADRLGGIMTAHILFKEIHPKPPTYSPLWLQQVLRQELGFTGVIFSDDLSMKGANHGTGTDAATRSAAALAAGCDVALLCNDPQGARRAADALQRDGLRYPTGLAALRADTPPPLDADALEQAAEALAADLG